MVKIHLTRDQKNHLMKYVMQSMLMRHSIHESQQYLKTELGIDYSPVTISHLRSNLKKQAQKELAKLRKDRFEFKYQYIQRIKEIEWIIQERHKMYNNPESRWYQRDKCLVELKDLTIILNNFYDLIPVIDSYEVLNYGQLSDSNEAYQPKDVQHIQQESSQSYALPKLPESELITDVSSRQAFLDKQQDRT